MLTAKLNWLKAGGVAKAKQRFQVTIFLFSIITNEQIKHCVTYATVVLLTVYTLTLEVYMLYTVQRVHGIHSSRIGELYVRNSHNQFQQIKQAVRSKAKRKKEKWGRDLTNRKLNRACMRESWY